MSLKLNAVPYEDARAKAQEVDRQQRIRDEPLPGKGSQVSTQVVRLRADPAAGLAVDGFERGVSGLTPALVEAVKARGGSMVAKLTPLGNIDGQYVNPTRLLLEMKNIGYEVTPM